MCERPAILRGLRRVDALAMAACALALALAPPTGRPATTARADAALSAPAAARTAGADPAGPGGALGDSPAGTRTAHR
jgi:hypothetical protein